MFNLPYIWECIKKLMGLKRQGPRIVAESRSHAALNNHWWQAVGTVSDLKI